MNISTLAAVACSVAATASLLHAQPQQWTVADGGSGHWYQLVASPQPMTWPEARAAAQAAGGDLACITSAAENNWLFSRFDVSQTICDPSTRGWFIGGFQDVGAPDYSEPAGGWRWVSGEPWSYTNWYPGRPDNYLGDQRYAMFAATPYAPYWDDAGPSAGNLLCGYMVEWQSLPVIGQYCPGFVWNRQHDWYGGAGGGLDGNPNSDANGHPVWRYSAMGGGGIGSTNPWYLGTAISVMGSASSSGGTFWVGGNAFAYRESMLHEHGGPACPGVEWLNPTGQSVEVTISGLLGFAWDSGATFPVDYVITRRNAVTATTALLYSATVGPSDYPLRNVSISAVTVGPSESLLFSFRAKQGSQGHYNLTDSINIVLGSRTCGPAITSQPLSASAVYGQPAALSVAATGSPPLQFQWRRNGVILSDGGHILGATTSTLIVFPFADSDFAAYDVVVSNACGSARSDAAALRPVPLCPADFNHSGNTSVQDIFDFLAAYFAGCP